MSEIKMNKATEKLKMKWFKRIFDKETKQTIKIELAKTTIVVLFLGVFAFYLLNEIKEARALPIRLGSNSDVSWEERYEITVDKEDLAEFNVLIHWKNGTSEDYGTFGMFLGKPLKFDRGDGWSNVTTIIYYSPFQTVKAQQDVKLIVKPKKARLRGDPEFFRGIDFRNDTIAYSLHIITDAVIYDEETNLLTYNFVVQIGSQPIEIDILKVEAILTEEGKEKGYTLNEAQMP